MRKLEIKDWLFYLGEEKNAWQKDYNDSTWTRVTVPHDWSIEQPFTREASSGTGYLPGGIGWYRGYVSLSDLKIENTTRLVFEGVYKKAQVWVNGYHIGGHPSGYATFSFDISEIISYNLDEQLVITVRVDHQDITDSRWYNGSGITRPVYIESHEKIQIIENGTFFETVRANSEEALIRVSHEVLNQSLETKVYKVISSLKSLETGDETVSEHIQIFNTEEQHLILFEMTVLNPLLWSDTDPHLYQLTTTFFEEDERICSYDEFVGIRTFKFDPDSGFFINNENKKLKGVCLHEDAGNFGIAVPTTVWIRRLLKLKEMGANAIRMAHNPHSKNLYRLCDLLGFYVIDEVFDEWENPKNKWWQGHNVYPPKHEGYAEFFPNWHKIDLENMIETNKNHPSIIAWSIGNEIDYPNDPYANPLFEKMTGNNDASKPSAERIYNPNRPDTRRLSTIAKRLIDIAKKLDRTRPITLALAFPELSSHTGLLDHLDLVGYNYKEHLYEKDHQRFPYKPFIGSENGHEYHQWLKVFENKYIGGQFLWTGIDYLGEAHGWPLHGSGAGLLTMAGFEKSNFYLRQSWWTNSPMLRLYTRPKNENHYAYHPFYEKWDYPIGQEVEVFAFSNCESVNLIIGEQKREMVFDKKKGYFSLCFYTTQEKLIAIGVREGQEVKAQLSLRLGATSLEVKQWKVPKSIQMKAKQAKHELESSLYQLEGFLVDRNGELAANDLKIHVKVYKGRLVGLENGNLEDITAYSESYRSTFEGRLMIYVEGDQETRITISGPGLERKEWKLITH